jgi:hypothetical protein
VEALTSWEEPVAVFDNDGTLWSEKPMPVELGFSLQRLAAMAEENAKAKRWTVVSVKDDWAIVFAD